MTCASGASVKPGVDSAQWIPIDRSLWDALSVGPPSWLDFILSTFIADEQQVSGLCAANPADPADLSAGTIAAAILRDPVAIEQVIGWVKQKLTYVAFTDYCVCNGGTGGSSAPCTYQDPGVWHIGTNVDLGSCGFAGTCGYPHGEPFAIPAGQHHVRLNAVSISSWPVNVALYDPVTSGELCRTTWTGAGQTLECDYPLARTGWAMYYQGPSAQDLHFTVDFWNAVALGEASCTSAPTTPTAQTQPTQPPTLTLPASPTCGTTADLCTQLQRLAEKIDWLIRSQPSLPQNGSISEGTVHAGLTGAGTLSVSGIRGARVLLTTVPSYIGSVSGSPPLEMRAGRVQFETAEGWSPAIWNIHGNPTEILGIDPLTTTVGYTFPPGVVATITELVRGP